MQTIFWGNYVNLSDIFGFTITCLPPPSQPKRKITKMKLFLRISGSDSHNFMQCLNSSAWMGVEFISESETTSKNSILQHFQPLLRYHNLHSSPSVLKFCEKCFQVQNLSNEPSPNFYVSWSQRPQLNHHKNSSRRICCIFVKLYTFCVFVTCGSLCSFAKTFFAVLRQHS